MTTTSSLLNAWMLGGWNMTGGLEIPVAGSFILVPRLHFQSASGPNSGSIHWGRAALGTRIHQPGGTYLEAGLGMGLLSAPVTDYDQFTAHRRQDLFGTPFFQFIAGQRFSVDDGPSLMAEVAAVFGIGPEMPGGLELVVGFSY